MQLHHLPKTVSFFFASLSVYSLHFKLIVRTNYVIFEKKNETICSQSKEARDFMVLVRSATVRYFLKKKKIIQTKRKYEVHKIN